MFKSLKLQQLATQKKRQCKGNRHTSFMDIASFVCASFNSRCHAVNHRDKRAGGFGDEADLGVAYIGEVVALMVVTLPHVTPEIGCIREENSSVALGPKGGVVTSDNVSKGCIKENAFWSWIGNWQNKHFDLILSLAQSVPGVVKVCNQPSVVVTSGDQQEVTPLPIRIDIPSNIWKYLFGSRRKCLSLLVAVKVENGVFFFFFENDNL